MKKPTHLIIPLSELPDLPPPILDSDGNMDHIHSVLAGGLHMRIDPTDVTHDTLGLVHRRDRANGFIPRDMRDVESYNAGYVQCMNDILTAIHNKENYFLP